MAEGLPHCPFCGNEHPEITSGDGVYCDGCGASAPYDSWNRRTPVPSVVRLLEAARAIRAFLWGKTLPGGQEKFQELCAAIAEVESRRPGAN